MVVSEPAFAVGSESIVTVLANVSEQFWSEMVKETQCTPPTLKTIPVGIAYAVWSGVGIVLITTVAWIVFDQKLDVWGIIGIVLIMSGVLILNLLSKSSSH